MSIENKRRKEEKQRLMEICNRFVNNYFRTMQGHNFAKDHSSTYTKTNKADQAVLDELQRLG